MITLRLDPTLEQAINNTAKNLGLTIARSVYRDTQYLLLTRFLQFL